MYELICPNCGKHYTFNSKWSLFGFTPKCPMCGVKLSKDGMFKEVNLSLWLSAFIILIVGVMFITRPNKREHVEKIYEIMIQPPKSDLKEDDEIIEGLAYLFAPAIIQSRVEVLDCYIFSIGFIEYEGESRVATIGLLNRVIPLVELKE